jgi:hypothetical protein
MTCFATKTKPTASDRAGRLDLGWTFEFRLIVLCAATFAINLVGCGSGGDAETGTTSKPTAVLPDPAAPSTPNPAPDTDTGLPTEPEDSASSKSDGIEWTVLFRASDPGLWNKASDDENAFSIPLDDFDQEIRWLRMRRVETNDAAIIPLAREDLLKVKELDDGIFWNGTGRAVTSAGKSHRKLGIAGKAFNGRYKSKAVLILNHPRVSGSGWSGWGFGKIALIHSPQYFAWAGERIPETVFEISVTNGDLSLDEKVQLVIPEFGLSVSSKVAASTPADATPPKSETPPPASVVDVVPDSSTTTVDARKRQPVPNDAARIKAGDAIRKLFEQEYEDATNQQAASLLAGKLLEQSGIADNDAAKLYVLLAESRELATNAGDAQTALAAVAEMADQFDIDSLAEKLAVLNRAANKARLPIAHRRLAEATLPVIYEAVSAGDFDAAALLASVARTGARKGRALDLKTIFQAVSEDISQFKNDSDAARDAREALDRTPDAGAEHLTLAVFLCLTEGHWQEGFRHLALSEDNLLKQITELELADPATPQAKVEVADLWMAWIKKTRRKPYDRFSMAADFWYRSALPELIGAERTAVEKRLREIGTLSWIRATANSNEPSVTLPDLSISSSKLATPWTVIFRSSEPADWNPVNAPQNMRYLRIARADAGDYVIIELTIDNLRLVTEGAFMWNGRNRLHTGARRLGIGNAQWYHGYTKGSQIVPKSDHKDGYGGWGFGRPCAVHVDQVFLWFDKRIPETVFEIAVTPAALHVTERKYLLVNQTAAVN